ncbi:MAG: hypothetical protein O3C40_02195 [Planctomycetota bacterium]|nr:hypothetical protein [Planctomycetota bacterium]
MDRSPNNGSSAPAKEIGTFATTAPSTSAHATTYLFHVQSAVVAVLLLRAMIGRQLCPTLPDPGIVRAVLRVMGQDAARPVAARGGHCRAPRAAATDVPAATTGFVATVMGRDDKPVASVPGGELADVRPVADRERSEIK